MAANATISWRRWAHQGGVWNLFSWFGRSTDQMAGLLLHPLVLVVYARSLNDDPARIAWFITVFGVAWTLGYAVAPVLQQMTQRVMPWILGGYIVRTTSVVLLAFVVSERSAGVDQRFRSALICYAAYAAATGVARSSQARSIVHGTAHGLWDNSSVFATIATQLVIIGGAAAVWSALREADLAWSIAFGRVWYLAAVALGISALAAIKQSAEAPETPRSEPARTELQVHSADRTRAIWLAVLIAAGSSAILFVEGLAFLAVFEDFRRQSILVRGSVGFFAIGWVVGSGLWGVLRVRYMPTFLSQLALGFSMVGLLGALALNDLARGSWFPDDIGGVESVRFGVYLIAAVLGAGTAGRRYMLNPVFARVSLTTWPRIGLSLLAALAPVGVARAVQDLALQTTLGIGIGLCMVIVIALGVLDRSGAVRLPRESDDSVYAARLAMR